MLFLWFPDIFRIHQVKRKKNAIALLLVRNLRIQSNWQIQELQSVQNSIALGPFSLVGRSIEPGTGEIVQSGMQVMAWVCQVMPSLPPSPSPL